MITGGLTRGIASITKGMQSMLDFQDVTAHNLANVTTNGFKRSQITFQDILESDVQSKTLKGNYKNVGTLSIGSRADRTYIDFSQGGLKESQNNLDVAFQGEGFFKVRYRELYDDAIPYNEKNYYYQRTGNFELDDNNYLVNKDGDFIMDTRNRKIRITRNPDSEDLNEINRFDFIKDILIGENGQMEINNENFRVPLAKIQICDFEDKTKISCIGEAKYLPIYGENPGVYTKADGTFSLQQGMNEMSNVSTITEMLNTINVSRGYETMSNILRQESETLSRAISLGNISGGQ